MDGWMFSQDGRDRWMDGWMDGWMEQTDGWMDRWGGGEEERDGLVDGQTGGRMDGMGRDRIGWDGTGRGGDGAGQDEGGDGTGQDSGGGDGTGRGWGWDREGRGGEGRGGEGENPCCSFPCENRGVCMVTGVGSYTCDCENTGFYGQTCEKLRGSMIDSPPLYTSEHDYVTYEAFSNRSYFARALPPTINGETWPLHLKDADVPMSYPPNVPQEIRFALGHKDFGLLPGLFMYATIWMREHNRVCDVLKGEHPEWDDEQLFQTGKLVILGETIKITIEDYVQHLSNYHYQLKFKPELLFGESHQYSNRITAEFNHMYHWHPIMPETFNISGTTYGVKDFLFRPDIVVKHGMRDFVNGLVNERAGAFTTNNHNEFTLPVAKQTIQHGRTIGKDLGFCRETEIAHQLSELYGGEIDAVEFYVGLVAEKTRPNAIFGSTIIELGGPFSVKGLMSAPICSKQHWKPSTFGGDVGFDLVKSATLEKLFCQNIDDCPHISFNVPYSIDSDIQTEQEDLDISKFDSIVTKKEDL
ncbi:PGH2-like protein [Mya arenaria]|uniref:PGH2-like protein n=1 Tax=Mya arenaria TaxID=6604 RepID=A0ABY7GGE2_MYAAR|nr:PGH2-like protein [Mya arenaria]